MLKILSGERRDLWAKIVRLLLLPLLFLYISLICLRYLLYKVKVLKSRAIKNLTIICVGNISAGGTGKTPAVAYICQLLSETNHKIAIVSRGYHKNSDENLNDEGKLLQKLLPQIPHYQDKDRYQACIDAQAAGATCIVMDDGFSHLKLARDLNIVLIDSTRPFGFFELLPRGLLREPPSALKRADIVILTRTNQVNDEKLRKLRSKIQKHFNSVKIFNSIHHPTCLKSTFEQQEKPNSISLSDLSGKSAFVFAGTGNPQSILKTYQELDLNVVDFKVFPDHHKYDLAELENIVLNANKLDVDIILTTSKDAIKIFEFQDMLEPMIYYVQIEFKVTEEDTFKKYFQQTLNNQNIDMKINRDIF